MTDQSDLQNEAPSKLSVQHVSKRFAGALLNQAIDCFARCPVEPLRQCLLLQSQIAQLKKGADFLAFLGNVVKDLKQERKRPSASCLVGHRSQKAREIIYKLMAHRFRNNVVFSNIANSL